MTLHAPYDPENIFAKILRGDMPCVKVFEDDETLAFMDVFPQSEGHTLVIPKNVEARNLLEIPAAEISSLFTRVQVITKAVEAALKPDGLTITQFNGSAAGQTVFHLHVHIIPRWETRSLGGHGEGMADIEALEHIAQKIRAEL